MQEESSSPPAGAPAAAFLRWGIVAITALLATWSLLSWTGIFNGRPRPPETRKNAGTPAAGGMSTGTSQVPGLATVVLPAEQLAHANVVTETARRRTIQGGVETVAAVSADETRIARVQTRFSGWIEKLNVGQTGQRVRKGEVLAEVFSRELFTAQQEWLNAKRWPDAGGAELAAQARQRLELLGIAPEELAAVERSGQPIRALPIRSPSSGYVVFKGAVEGIFVDPGTELFEIADLDRVWAWADVYERDLSRLQVGQRATLSIPALSGRTFEGRVTFLQPVLDPRNRTLKARIELSNPALALKPGMYGTATIETAGREALVVPRDAVVDTGERQVVFVKLPGDRFQPRVVHAGAPAGDEIEILDGLQAGEEVVSRGSFLLDSESRLRAAVQGSPGTSPRADIPIDREKYPRKYDAWLECERAHRGMGSMEEDCKNAIPKPWR